MSLERFYEEIKTMTRKKNWGNCERENEEKE